MLLLNGQPVPVTIFSDNTSQVWKLPESTFESNRATVRWEYSNEAEVMHLAQLQELLLSHDIRTTLEIPYLPYARQDKPISNGTTFALNTFLRIIQSLRFDKLIVTDPHNFDAVRPGCAVDAVYPKAEIAKVLRDECISILCYPDKGALTKYSKIYDYNYIYGEKVRDQLTGNITSYKLVGDPTGKNVLIVDDICDFGRTFILLTKDLLAAGAREVSLFVSHGLFSGGIRVLKEAGINKVFTPEGEALGDRIRNQI